MSEATAKSPAAGAGAVQSAAAPSPFPPIADYAFLSNCHTGALVAADGAIDWLCVPAFDSPSVFGSLLDRQAGFFRLAPYGITHPSARVYEPGTNVLLTTWKTPQGWIEVRDALTMGPYEGDDSVTPHTRPPADDDGDHMLVRTIRCLDGRVEVELVCEPVVDYGRTPAEWTLVGNDRHVADATGRYVDDALKGDVVGLVGAEPQVRQEVLDFHVIKEALAADDPVRDCTVRHLWAAGPSSGQRANTT